MSEAEYYKGHFKVPKFGPEGQAKLGKSYALIIGAGGLGCAVLPYIAGTGIGKIDIFDGDTVSFNNLHRQVFYSTKDIGDFKAEIAAEKCRKINPHIAVRAFTKPFDQATAQAMLATSDQNQNLTKPDIIFDCTDNLGARLLISDAAARYQVAVVSGSALRSQGQLLLYGGHLSGCYRCLLGYKDAGTSKFTKESPWDLYDLSQLLDFLDYLRFVDTPLDCATAGILGPIPGLIGTHMVISGIKILLRGLPEDCQASSADKDIAPNYGTYDFDEECLMPSFDVHKLQEDRKCPYCVERKMAWDPFAYAGLSLAAEHQVEWKDLEKPCFILDVRPSTVSSKDPLPLEQGVVSLPLTDIKEQTVKIASDIKQRLTSSRQKAQSLIDRKELSELVGDASAVKFLGDPNVGAFVYVSCARGNSSKTAVYWLCVLNRLLIAVAANDKLSSLSSSDPLANFLRAKVFVSVVGGRAAFRP